MILLAVMLTSTVMMAQKTDRTNAYMYNKNGQYEKAAESIEKCVHHESFLGMKPKDQAQAWLYRGMIYLNIHQNPELAAKYPDCLEKAYEALENCIKADAGYAKDNAQDVYPRIAAIAVNYFQDGVTNFNNQAYPEAASSFRKSYDISKNGAAPDTSALVNTALSYQRAKMWDEAIVNYNDLKELGYNHVDLYKNLAACYLGKDDQDNAVKVIEDGMAKFPGDAGMIIEKVNMFLKQGKGEEALSDLNKLAELDPNNPSILFILGTIYGDDSNASNWIGLSESKVIEALGAPKNVDVTSSEFGTEKWLMYDDDKSVHIDKNGKVDIIKNLPAYTNGIYNPDKAIAYYTQAININPEYYDAIYNLGALYITMSNKLKAEANEITGFSKAEIEKYDSLVKQAEDLVRTGLPYVKQAYEAQPSDDIKHVLKSMYVQLNMLEEAKELE